MAAHVSLGTRPLPAGASPGLRMLLSDLVETFGQSFEVIGARLALTIDPN